MEKQGKWKLLATSDSLDELKSLIMQYSYLNACILHDDGSIENSRGIIPGWRWRFYRGSYRFESFRISRK